MPRVAGDPKAGARVSPADELELPMAETILVVDDNAQNRLVAEGHLHAAGYDVVVAEGGERALAVFRERSPDLVLLDILMPGLDGFQTCAALRQLAGGPETPIVFLTALGDLETHGRAMASGGDDYLTKPIHRTELLLRVKSLLRIRRFSRDLKRSYQMIRYQRDALAKEKRLREQLVAFLASDLGAPLATIESCLASVVGDPLLSDEYREPLEVARRATQNASRLARGMLDVNRSQDGALTTTIVDVDLRAMLEDLRFEATGRAELAGQRIVLRFALDQRTLPADRDLLRRALENLLENALRVAPSPSTITVEAQTFGGAFVDVRVRDEGPGVPPALREKIFDKYTRVESSPPESVRAGSGLGLTFCRVVAHAHGGSVWVEDGEPRGAVFCLRLPLRGGAV
jgi:signal transduction histidine kinase